MDTIRVTVKWMGFSLFCALIPLLAAQIATAQSDSDIASSTTPSTTATQPVATAPALTEIAFPDTPASRAYHQWIARAVQAFRETLASQGQRRTESIARAASVFERNVEQADAVYRAAVVKAFTAVTEVRSAALAAATSAYERDARALRAAGDTEQAKRAEAAKAEFLAAADAESAAIRAAATTLPAVTPDDLRPAPPPTFVLRIRARIDGSDECTITRDGATWVHKAWDWPPSVEIDDLKWVPAETNVLQNAGTTRFLPPRVDFARARVLSRSGRGVVACESSPEGLRIVFADVDGGSDVHEIAIELPTGRPRD